LASHALANQKHGTLARLSAIDSLLGFAPDHHLKSPEKIKAITPDDIKAAARKYFGTREPVVVTVAPKA
ncbi:MAG: hypothetical protein KJO79_10300, partial [Verrucomicrobiae bacterium]|nr:hypothetical protein [Verrucomicrobiae bacterium]NNJ87561.1 hypothetical protein [Akkermansiaceae bacterium]